MNNNDCLTISKNRWPVYTDATIKKVLEVFENNRFTISGYWTGKKSMEQVFAKKFAEYNGVPYCVPTSNGSNALVVALEALDIGFEDEVIVPALTWLATATSVLNVNAFPVIIDVDPDTYCMDANIIESYITEKTKAIIPVHLYGCMSDMDAVMSIAKKHNLKVIEDCAQTHGSIWKGKKAGTIGDVGAFSFEQSKTLSSGEGGCVITKDTELYELLSQLRVDSRVFTDKTVNYGDLELIELGRIQGSNYKMTEIQAAILIEQLEYLEELNIIREENALYLDNYIKLIPGLKIMKRLPQINRQSYFSYCIKVDSQYFDCSNDIKLLLIREKILKSLRERLGIPQYFLHPSYQPLNTSKMFCPWTKRRYPESISKTEEYWRNLNLPVSSKAVRESIVFHHSILLKEKKELDLIVNVLDEIVSNIKKRKADI